MAMLVYSNYRSYWDIKTGILIHIPVQAIRVTGNNTGMYPKKVQSILCNIQMTIKDEIFDELGKSGDNNNKKNQTISSAVLHGEVLLFLQDHKVYNITYY